MITNFIERKLKQMMSLKILTPLRIISLLCLCCCFKSLWAVEEKEREAWGSSLVVKRDERRIILQTEFGEISAVEIGDRSRINGSFHLQFFKLEPNALFLPVMLHTEMLLYCHSGSGDLTWTGHGEKPSTVSLSKGDVYRVRQGSVFFIRSNLGTEQRERLRITALFANSNEDLHSRFSSMGPYSSIADLVRGFDSAVLQAAFQAPEEVIQTIKSAIKQPLIIQDVSSQKEEEQSWDWEGRSMRLVMSLEGAKIVNKKKHKKSRAFNVYTADRDFENCNGWSLTMTSKNLETLKDSAFGAFYVNLTKGVMMAPHWNPMATEIAFVVSGQGMVRIVCSSSEGNQSDCVNQRFRVEEGDVFMVPRFHPMSQTSFNNDSFVFMGFSTTRKRNYPQYLVGKQSVFQVIDKDVLAAAFNVNNETIIQLSGQQQEALIVECTSCAEEQFSVWQEREHEREARKREEEEAERRKEEEAKRREEEEARRREKEAREQERKRQEEEAAREEEDRRQREEQAEREEEERRRREEERAERERRQREEEERAEQERKQREEEERKQWEEDERAEHERKQREEEERAEQERRQREEEARRQEERRQREEEAKRQEEERRRREEEEGRGGGGGGESEEEAARRQEEERERKEREESEGGAPEERQPRRQPQEEERVRQGESEGEAAVRQEEERIRRERERMERGRSAKPPIILVDKVVDLLF